jgi:ABC-type multidrug transport system ATPase subunit
VQAAIEARAIGQRGHARSVTLRDTSLTIGCGELVAIVGGAGSGKTTLLDALSGLRPPSSGVVVRQSAVQRIGYVPDADTLPPVLPLGRALRYTAVLRGVAASGDLIDGVLRLANLSRGAAVPVADLDPGERRRAAIAAELLAGPELMFLEEPTAGLDPAQGAEIMRLLRGRCDAGMTVVLTTNRPLDAVRCDRVAVLATGGHLAFYGTPDGACAYFGADSLDEIYERLAGLGDPAMAWSRRFFYFSQTRAGFLPALATPSAPGPGTLLPDAAGPHSAGSPSELTATDPEDDLAGLVPRARNVLPGAGRNWAAEPAGSPGPCPAGASSADTSADEAWTGPAETDKSETDASLAGSAGAGAGAGPGADRAAAAVGSAGGAGAGRRASRGPDALRPARQLPLLAARNAAVLTRSVPARVVFAGLPAALLVALAVLIGVGALDGHAAASAWLVAGGFGLGLGYGLPQVRDELGVLRAERFAGLNSTAYVLAKAAVVLPVLAVADAIVLTVPAACSRVPAGYGAFYLTMLLSSAVAYFLALLISVSLRGPPRGPSSPGAASVTLTLVVAAFLVVLDRAAWENWVLLAALTVLLLMAASIVIDRRNPCPRDAR